MAEYFDEAFPHYLAMGMTNEQFWEQDCQLVIPFRKAYQIRQEQQNQQAWLQGLYIWKALQCAPIFVNGFVPKGAVIEPYYDKPLDFGAERRKTKEQTNRQKMNDGVNYMQNLAMRFNNGFKAQKRKEADSKGGNKQ